MFKFRSLWAKFATWVDAKINRRKTLTQILAEGDEEDQHGIRTAEKVIVEHQCQVHMHRAAIAARASWRQLQLQQHGSEDANKPVPHAALASATPPDTLVDINRAGRFHGR